MEHTHSTMGDRPTRIPRLVWIVGGGLLIALVAVVIFKVPVNTVVYYGFFALMIGSHFFMHGSHGGHGDHSQQDSPPTNTEIVDSVTNASDTTLIPQATQPAERPMRHSGGCH